MTDKVFLNLKYLVLQFRVAIYCITGITIYRTSTAQSKVYIIYVRNMFVMSNMTCMMYSCQRYYYALFLLRYVCLLYRKHYYTVVGVATGNIENDSKIMMESSGYCEFLPLGHSFFSIYLSSKIIFIFLILT